MPSYILAIDQGTTSSRAIMFNDSSEILGVSQEEFTQYFPEDGWVEHDPEEIWSTTVKVVNDVISSTGVSAGDIAAIGITNQRETTVLWERDTGRPIHRAIVWQDRRTADLCDRLRREGQEPLVQARTGLLLDPYFSATKIAWLLDNVAGARARAERGDLAFGTVDSFLLWRLTGGRVHATDATNASRTMLFDIHRQGWDDDLLALWRIPAAVLPEVRDSAGNFGDTAAGVFERPLPIRGIAGDQHAATIGQACFEPGMVKSTYGTGCFVLLNPGPDPAASDNRLLTTVAYRLDGQPTYALEGSIFVAGSAMQWLRDELKIIESAAESAAIAEASGIVDNVHVVPAFAGLGAPYWDPDARGAILGLSRDSGINEIVTATLQAVAYQTKDLINAMSDDGIHPNIIRVDGGMVANDWFLQFLSDILNLTVERPQNVESTVLGAAYLAGLASGVFASTDEVQKLWRRQALFEPSMPDDRRDGLYQGWLDAVSRVRSTT